MLPDRVSNPGPLTYESGALLIALRGPAYAYSTVISMQNTVKVKIFPRNPLNYKWTQPNDKDG